MKALAWWAACHALSVDQKMAFHGMDKTVESLFTDEEIEELKEMEQGRTARKW